MIPARMRARRISHPPTLPNPTSRSAHNKMDGTYSQEQTQQAFRIWGISQSSYSIPYEWHFGVSNAKAYKIKKDASSVPFPLEFFKELAISEFCNSCKDIADNIAACTESHIPWDIQSSGTAGYKPVGSGKPGCTHKFGSACCCSKFLGQLTNLDKTLAQS